MRLIQMHQCCLRGAETHKLHFAPESNYSGFSLHLPFSTDTEATTKAISTVMNIYRYSYGCDIKVTKRLFWRKMEARMREVTRERGKNRQILHISSHMQNQVQLYIYLYGVIGEGRLFAEREGRRDGNEA